MDIKVNGNRLKNMLSYDWVKIVVAIVAGIVVWVLLFTMLATRSTVGEEFVFMVYENVKTVNSAKNGSLLSDMKKDGTLSFDVLELNVSYLNSAGQYSASYMLSLRASVQEGDVLLISDGRAVEVEEGKEDEEDPSSEISSVINGGYLYNFETFLTDARTYCVSNGFIVENQDGTYSVDEDEIETYFLNVRLKSAGNYRKTFRTELQKQEGVKLEIKRIIAIYENYLFVKRAIDQAKAEDNDILWYGDLKQYDEDGKVIEGEVKTYPFGIDLYKLNKPFIDSQTDKKADISEVWYTYANGKTTSEGLVMGVFDFQSYQPDLQYESLAFIKRVIETYSGYGHV
ncbi:MAG: hypothetical protein IJW64_04420 [Clostridia bacterium]|nr:hypothetical protein [Clostridia bacterium]